MAPNTEHHRVETKAEAEGLIPLFVLERILNQDQNGRRITLLGKIRDEPAVLTLERAAFPSDAAVVSSFLSSLANTTNLGANDVYRWYMSSCVPGDSPVPDVKLNLIYPCTPAHVRKYTSQKLRYVTETPEVYKSYVRPYVDRTQRTPKRVDWIYNILDGITEQDDIVYRSQEFGVADDKSTTAQPKGFLLLPDLNWDRKTLTSLHLLALVERRDLTSLRDLRVADILWLKSMVAQIRTAAAAHGNDLARAQGLVDAELMDVDQVKCYIHYQPTYYHFHVHVVHVSLEPEGGTQSVGKAFGLETLVAMLEGMATGGSETNVGLDSMDLTYFIGEESEIWKKCFARLKHGERVDLLDGI